MNIREIVNRVRARIGAFKSPSRNDWEGRALMDAQNIVNNLMDEVVLARFRCASEGDREKVFDLDETLAFLQHTVVRILRDILERPKGRRFNEALDCVLRAGEHVADAMQLEGYSWRLQAKIGNVEWLAMRASAYAEVAETIRTGRVNLSHPDYEFLRETYLGMPEDREEESREQVPVPAGASNGLHGENPAAFI